MKNTISIKGTRDGLTITLGEGPFAELLEDLKQHLETQGMFFRGGTVTLQASDRAISEDEFSHLDNLLSTHEMALRMVASTSQVTRQVAKSLGLHMVEQPAPQEIPAPPKQAPILARAQDSSKGLLMRHVVRAGQIIRHTGHVVIVGDVNASAEIIAGGDVVIWGRLYGTVHAGAMGDSMAVVCALELVPQQLRIGDLVARPGEGDRLKKPYPEVASVRDNMIIVEPWDRALRGV